MATTWNPSDKNADITLTGSNLIATGNNASVNGGVRGSSSHATGKWMIEFDAVTLSGAGDSLDYVGIGIAADTLGLASGNQIQAIICQNGTEFSGTGSSALNYPDFSPLASNCTIQLCVDLTNLLMWFRINGGNWNGSGTANPATGTGGNAMAASGTFLPYTRLTNGSTATLNTTPSSPPSGFASWDAAAVPFPYGQSKVIA